MNNANEESKLSPEQIQELEEKINAFDKSVESSIEIDKESFQNGVESGEYSTLVTEGDRSPMEGFTLSDTLQEELDKVECTEDELVEFAIENDHFKMNYEEQSSPFQYGGAEENEFKCIDNSGDKSTQIDKSSCLDHMPTFLSDLKKIFPTYDLFEKFVNYEIGRQDHLKHFFNLFWNDDQDHVNVTYNTSYDVIRCVLDNEDELIKFIKSKPVKVDKFTPKVLKLSKSEFDELNESHSGFCEYCGRVNDGGHEPDAEKYKCSNCEKNHSYGIETAYISGKVIIVDQEESELDSAYE